MWKKGRKCGEASLVDALRAATVSFPPLPKGVRKAIRVGQFVPNFAAHHNGVYEGESAEVPVVCWIASRKAAKLTGLMRCSANPASWLWRMSSSVP